MLKREAAAAGTVGDDEGKFKLDWKEVKSYESKLMFSKCGCMTASAFTTEGVQAKRRQKQVHKIKTGN